MSRKKERSSEGEVSTDRGGGSILCAVKGTLVSIVRTASAEEEEEEKERETMLLIEGSSFFDSDEEDFNRLTAAMADLEDGLILIGGSYLGFLGDDEKRKD